MLHAARKPFSLNEILSINIAMSVPMGIDMHVATEAAARAGIPDLTPFLTEQSERIRNLCDRKLGYTWKADADRVAQDVLIKFLQHLSGPTPLLKSEYKRWLTTVAINECREFHRRHIRQLKTDDTLDAVPGEQNKNSDGKRATWQPEELPVSFRENPGEVAANLASLSRKERAVFILRETDLGLKPEELKRLLGKRLATKVKDAKAKWRIANPPKNADVLPKRMSVSEISRVLDLPSSTVRSHSTRARAKLKALVGDPGRASSVQRLAPEEVKCLPSRGALKSLYIIDSEGRSEIPEDEEARILRKPDLPVTIPVEDSSPLPLPAPTPLKAIAYKSGSPFKGCKNCGETTITPSKLKEGKEIKGRKIYTSGFDVWRARLPKQTGWTYRCFGCGAQDLMCWENCDEELGEEPRLLTHTDAEANRAKRREPRRTQRPGQTSDREA